MIIKCKIKGCNRKLDMKYYGKPLCSKCFEKYDSKQLKNKLNIKEEVEEKYHKEEISNKNLIQTNLNNIL